MLVCGVVGHDDNTVDPIVAAAVRIYLVPGFRSLTGSLQSVGDTVCHRLFSHSRCPTTRCDSGPCICTILVAHASTDARPNPDDCPNDRPLPDPGNNAVALTPTIVVLLAILHSETNAGSCAHPVLHPTSFFVPLEVLRTKDDHSRSAGRHTESNPRWPVRAHSSANPLNHTIAHACIPTRTCRYASITDRSCP